MDYEELFNQENLFQTTLEKEVFVWRTLTMKEFNRFEAIRGSLHPYIFYNMVFKRCFFGNPEALNQNLPAGITVSIGKLAYWYSGECSQTTIVSDLSNLRGKYGNNSLIQTLKNVIYTAWSGLTPEYFDNLSYQQMLERFSEAELLIKFKNPEYAGIDLRKIELPGSTPKQPKGIITKEQMMKENLEHSREFSSNVHPLDMDMESFAKLAQKPNKRQVAKKLDRARR